MKKIFKYFPNEILDIVFQRDGFCGLKCSYPKDYNDPFELFLSINPTTPPNLLAFYNDVVQDIPQLPTTCFSKSPTVTPMWAHYAGNQTGFVLEFDVGELKKWNDGIKLKDVVYQNQPNDQLLSLLTHAAGTKKPRHSYFLTNSALNTAYFTKFEQWSYEQESRLVVSPDDVEIIDGHQVLFIPSQVLSAIIIGPNFPVAAVESSNILAKKNKIDWYQLSIGKSTSTPYMIKQNGKSCTFSGRVIVAAESTCENCKEPTSENSALCSWCRITESDKIEAAGSNPFRILDAHGLLEKYFNSADKVGK